MLQPGPRSAAGDPSPATDRVARRCCASAAKPSNDRYEFPAAGTARARCARGHARPRSRSDPSARAPSRKFCDHGVTLKSPATISGPWCSRAKDAMPASSPLRSREVRRTERPVQMCAEHRDLRAVPVEGDARREPRTVGQRDRLAGDDRPAREHDHAVRQRLVVTNADMTRGSRRAAALRPGSVLRARSRRPASCSRKRPIAA